MCSGVMADHSVATSPVVLRWLCDSPRTGYAWRTTPYIYVGRTSNNRMIMACELYCCLLPQCEALRICRSGFPIATIASAPKFWHARDLRVPFSPIVRSLATPQRHITTPPYTHWHWRQTFLGTSHARYCLIFCGKFSINKYHKL